MSHFEHELQADALRNELGRANQTIALNNAEINRLRTECDMLIAQNDPEWDGTDGAHPAWWRSQDDTFKHITTTVLEWLDGANLSIEGGQHPMGEIRDRIKALQRDRQELITRCEGLGFRLAAYKANLNSSIEPTEDDTPTERPSPDHRYKRFVQLQQSTMRAWLQALETTEDDTPTELLQRFACATCGEQFSIMDMEDTPDYGVICQKCRGGNPDGKSLDTEAFEYIQSKLIALQLHEL